MQNGYASSNICMIGSDKPANAHIIISTLEIIQPNLLIVVVTAVSERVDGCNIHILGKLSVGYRICYSAPSIVGVFCNSLCILINDSDYVTLQILYEIVGNSIVENTANTVLVIVEGNKSISVPSFTKNLCSIKCIPASIANG